MKFQRKKGVRRSIGVSNPTKFIRTEVATTKTTRLSMLAIPEEAVVYSPKTTIINKKTSLKISNSTSFLRKKFQLKKIKMKIQSKFSKVEVEEIFCPAVSPNDNYEWTRIRSSSELNDFDEEDFVAWEEDSSKFKFLRKFL
jgi:hypothetical protein